MTTVDRSVLTLAVGKPVYVQMAVNFARSFRHWHRDGRIAIAIATDRPELLPNDLDYVTLITLAPNQFGSGFSPKLHLDRLAPAEHTLFVDSDCLCVGPLDPVFERFRGHAVSVVGHHVAEGEWFGDVAATCRAIGVSQIVKFNGGLYYLEPGELCTRVYETARALEPRYDELGLVRLRGRPNDELLMASAMAMHGLNPVPDDGCILSDPQACPVDVQLDVLRGGSRLVNPPPPHPLHRGWNPLRETRPVLVHFLANYAEEHPYTREALRLQLVEARGWPVTFADIAAALARTLPTLGARFMKRVARPLYRLFFGTRPVAVSPRV
jgi:hypothetical protein